MEIIWGINEAMGDPLGISDILNEFLWAIEGINNTANVVNESMEALAVMCLIITIVIGIIQAFWGYKLTRFWIVLIGCFNGLIIGAILGAAFSGGESESAILCALIGMVCGGFLAYYFYLLGVFFLCAGWGFLIIAILTATIADSFSDVIAMGFLGAITIGALGVVFTKPMFIILTSFGGGMSAGMAAMGFHPAFGILVGLVSVIAGFRYQCKSNGNIFNIGLQSSTQLVDPEEEPEEQKRISIPEVTERLSTEFKQIKTSISEVWYQESREEMPAQATSKTRKMLTFNSVHIKNDRELWNVGFPVVMTQVELVDLDELGNLGLYLGFQNLRKQQITAIYVDVRGYNVLKELRAELKDICFLDLNISEGQIHIISKAVAMLDKSIRRCEVFVRHVVFDNEEIWSGEGTICVQPLEKQNLLMLADLREEFQRLAELYMPGKSVYYQYEPLNQEDYWYCGCGQVNENSRATCLSCGIKKEDIFRLADTQYLLAERDLRLEQERNARAEADHLAAEKKAQKDALKARRQMEFQIKMEEIKKKTAESVRSLEAVSLTGKSVLKRNWKSDSKKQGCPNCGMEYETGSQFCIQCGYHLSEAQEIQMTGCICPNCEFDNEKGARFCIQCGKELDLDIK